VTLFGCSVLGGRGVCSDEGDAGDDDDDDDDEGTSVFCSCCCLK